MKRGIFAILCAILMISLISCGKIEDSKESNTLPQEESVSSTPTPVDMKKLVEDFMLAIDSKAIWDDYAVDYGAKFEYVFDEVTLEELQAEYPSIIELMDNAVAKIKSTSEPDALKNFKSDFIDLLIKKNKLLVEQMKAIEKGGKWNIQYKHGVNVNMIMALEHYGDNEDLIKRIQDYNLSAKEFIKKYDMDTKKYEFGDESGIFLIR